MAWRLAPTLVQLRKEVNEEWPLRDKTSDGTLGNAAHSASRSDHNPDSRGVVCAIDLDEDLQGSKNKTYPRFNPGQAGRILLDRLLFLCRAGKLPQVYYIIYEGVIYSRTYDFRARPYNGVNAHDRHLHISVDHEARLADRTTPWGIDPPPVIAKPKLDYAALLGGIKNPRVDHPQVKQVQDALNKWRGSLDLIEDGYWGAKTEKAYATFQAWKYDIPVGHPDANGKPGPESLGTFFSVINIPN